MKAIPRIRGRVGQAIDAPHKDKWFFEITVWDLNGENQFGEPLQVGPWDSKEIALDKMKEATQLCCEEAEKLAGCEPSGKYLDLKNGAVLRPWKEHS